MFFGIKYVWLRVLLHRSEDAYFQAFRVVIGVLQLYLIFDIPQLEGVAFRSGSYATQLTDFGI
jgi:hypothetical protein